MRIKPSFLFAITSLLTFPTFLIAQEKTSDLDKALAKKGMEFFNKFCTKCHHDDKQFEDLDVLSRSILVKERGEKEDRFIVPGDAGNSRIWQVVESGEMPYGDDQPTEDDKAILKKWISEGAQFPAVERPKREFVGEKTILKLIAADLDSQPIEQQKFTRYFSLFHLSNKTEGEYPVTDEELRLTRAAISKLMNSLSTKARIRRPRIVDKSATLMAIDLRHYGWSEWHWDQLLTLYPYGLRIGGNEATRVYRLTGTKIPHIRADWFVFTAARPPLYHDLLGVPKNAKSLERRLGVNILKSFLANEVQRAAFEISGVSDQNRMLERIDPNGGEGGRYYYKSYDMLPATEADADFSRNPNGPIFDQLKGKQIGAFKHDGGEIIWALKNGLQGYMLIDGKDVRIDQGPDDVVRDKAFHSGSFRIVNGISCFGCHQRGMVTWKSDEIRPLFKPLAGQAIAEKVLLTYPENDEMQDVVKGDERHYLAALEEAIGKFVREGKSDKREIRNFAEPITTVSKRYQDDITIFDAARELGLAEDVETAEKRGSKSVYDLKAQTKLLRESGLASFLRTGGTIRRQVWERQMQRIARELELGTPYREER